MLALRWCDVDFRRRQIVIQQAVWQGVIDVPKSGHGRSVPMTAALASALERARRLRGELVLHPRPVRCCPSPRPWTTTLGARGNWVGFQYF
jgi:hypothetical protein